MGTPLTSNIATQFLGGSNFAYFGFGAGTGGLSNTQSVRNISVTATFEGQAPALQAMKATPTQSPDDYRRDDPCPRQRSGWGVIAPHVRPMAPDRKSSGVLSEIPHQ